MDTNIHNITPLSDPFTIKNKEKINKKSFNFVLDSREEIKKIYDKTSKKLLVIMGPCSIHNYESAIEYAKFISKQRVIYKDTLEIVMRTYFSKPRTTIGWKGLIYDPNLNNSNDIEKGLLLARKILINIINLNVPTSMEHVDTIFPQYFDDLISWSAIGARSVECQVHRELASGLSTPVGFKNNTLGNIDVAINAIITANNNHNFIGCDEYGKISHISTNGNKYCNLILRGGKEPNYDEDNVNSSIKKLKDKKINSTLIIDFSHGNSQKVHKNQLKVCESVCEQIANKNFDIIGVMIESNLVEGNQKLNLDNIEDLIYGKSITDACIDLEDSKLILENLHEAVLTRNS